MSPPTLKKKTYRIDTVYLTGCSHSCINESYRKSSCMYDRGKDGFNATILQITLKLLHIGIIAMIFVLYDTDIKKY